LVFVTDYGERYTVSIASPLGNKAAHLFRSEAMAEVTKVFACRASCPKGAQQRPEGWPEVMALEHLDNRHPQPRAQMTAAEIEHVAVA
jgi:hypothetical protein